MPRVNINDVDNYNTGGTGGGFLQLKEHRQKVRVRFMLEDIEDLNDYIYIVHTCKVKGGSEYGTDVNCLREYNEPVDNCPLCAAGIKTSIKVFVPVWNEDEQKVQIWTRGKKMIEKLQSLMSRYKDFPSHIFEIERNGKPKDTGTTYEIYEVDQDDTTLDDLDELPKIEGMAFKEYTAEDMEYFLESGEFPPEDDDEDDVPVRRRASGKKKSKRHEEEDRPRRRRREEPEEDEDDEDDIPEDDDDDEEDLDEERPVRRSRDRKKTKKRRHTEDF